MFFKLSDKIMFIRWWHAKTRCSLSYI